MKYFLNFLSWHMVDINDITVHEECVYRMTFFSQLQDVYVYNKIVIVAVYIVQLHSM
jgi:hypothetical protein